MEDAALSYAKRGWHIFPLHSAHEGKCSCSNTDCDNIGKHPRTPNGLLNATTDTAQIKSWWDEWPNANIGIRTGQISGIFVVDLDIKKADGIGNWAMLQDTNSPLDTLIATTGGGGQHWVFKLPPDVSIQNGVGKFSPGIDVRGENGYIVAAPSIHEFGTKYEWYHRTAPTLPPDWLVALCQQKSSKSVNKDSFDPWVSDALSNGAEDGKRNATAIRLAGYFRAKSIPRDIILELLQPYAEKCDPPFGMPELMEVVDSAQRYQIQISEAKVEREPEIEERSGILYYKWADIGLTAEVDQLHRNKQGVHCELTLHANHSEPSRIVHGPVNYNMVSTTGRTSLVKYLKERWELDWMQVLEDLSRLGVAYLRSGNPIIDLREYSQRPTSLCALEPLILEDQPVIFFGEGGLGKSLLALASMLSLHYNIPVLPGTLPQLGHSGIYIDFEDQPYEQGERSHKMLAPFSVPDIARHYLRCDGPLHEQAQNIKRHISDNGITFAVIDSAAYACGGEGAEKSESAIAYFRALRYLNIPTITVAHNTKDSKSHMPFGSVFWHNSARATWEVVKQQDTGQNKISVGMFNQKANGSSLHKPLAFDVSFDSQSITFANTDIQHVPEFAAQTSKSDQLWGIMEGGQTFTIKEAAAITGIMERTVQTTLSRNTGRFVRVGTNMGAVKWGRKDNHHQA